jgi:serine/threonine protein kinase
MSEDESLWPMDSDLQTLSMLGTTIADRYKTDKLLGEGGMGTVYLATDELLGRQVAIKMMKPGPLGRQNSERFLREARSLARLNHPNIVTVYNYGWHGEQAYLVMEYATGVTLRNALEGDGGAPDSGKKLTIRTALDVAAAVGRALTYAHRKGVIHRDIKPGNIMIGDEIKLMDFGIAKMRDDPTITHASVPIGTPIYMAPEQALGREVDQRTDIYSFGVVLYEMLTGRPPFSACDEMSLPSQHVGVTPVAAHLRNPGIPKSLDSLVMKMLAKNPDKRPASAEEVLLALEAARQDVADVPGTDLPRRKEALSFDEKAIGALRGIPLFAAIPADDLCELSRHLTRRRYRKGEIIFHKDDFGSTLHIIESGNVKISIASEGGEETVLSYLGPGDFFGELALLDEKPRSATVTSVEATHTWALERGDFLDFLKWYPDAAIRILAVLAQRLRDVNAHLEDIIYSDPSARVAGTLLKLMQTHGSETPQGWEITLPLTQPELAGMAGVPKATVGRLLRQFHTAGVLRTENRRCIICNPEELRRRAARSPR